MKAVPRSKLGLVEGFYGVFYTFPERNDLIRFIGQHGYRWYVYAPKNDRQHRARWWDAYPAWVMEQFAQTVCTAQDAGVTFCYGISPGGSICYSSPDDFQRLAEKLYSFYEIGVRDFSLMLDDNEPGFRHEADARVYRSLPEAQADLANRLIAWLNELNPVCRLSFVPAEYSGRAPFAPALYELSKLLDPRIELCYTGPEVCSPAIEAEDAAQFAQAAGRKPLLWDNYPVNDLTMRAELHLGPVSGRSADLLPSVTGILVNPMEQAEASKIPLLTYAEYCADPDHYNPAAAWERAINAVAGEEYAAPLRLLAENTVTSCLGREGQKLEGLAQAALQTLQAGGPLEAPSVKELQAYLSEIDEAGYTLKFRLENLALRNNLLPWIEVLEHWMWMTRYAVQVLQALQSGQSYLAALNRVHEYREAIRRHPKRIATDALLPITEYVLDQVTHYLIVQNAVSKPDKTALG